MCAGRKQAFRSDLFADNSSNQFHIEQAANLLRTMSLQRFPLLPALPPDIAGQWPWAADIMTKLCCLPGNRWTDTIFTRRPD